MQVVFLPNFPERPTNPARVHVPSGRIEINKARWDMLTPEQREFVLAHEEGHYKLQTYDELKADQYALQQLALKKKNSLWNYVKSVKSVSKNDKQRVYHAEKHALEIAANKGSSEASDLLRMHYASADGKTPCRFALFALVVLAMVCAFILIRKKS